MPTPDLIERVRSLRDELGETQPDPRIDELKAQADKVLAEPDHAPHYTSLADRLRFHYTGFKNDHPALATSMQSLVDTLGKAGL